VEIPSSTVWLQDDKAEVQATRDVQAFVKRHFVVILSLTTNHLGSLE
jgi:hypothetical protein